MMPFFVTLVALAMPSLVSGAISPRDGRSLRIVVARPGRTTLRNVALEQLPQEARLKLGTPPVSFSGLDVREILKPELSGATNRDVVFAGADGYAIQLPERAVREKELLAAIARDGKPLPDGAPELRFAGQDALRLPSLSGVFFGHPDPFVGVRLDGATSVRTDLRAVASRFRRRMSPCFPAGERATPPPRGKIEVSLVPLASLAGQSGRPIAKIVVHTHVGAAIDVTSRADEYLLAYAWNGRTIAPVFGGPVQLIHRGEKAECRFFVDSIEL